MRNAFDFVLGLTECLIQQSLDVVSAQPVVPGSPLGALVDQAG